MNEYQKAIESLRLVESALHPDTAPRFDKSKIKEAQQSASEGLLLAIKLLERECAYCESGVAEIHNHEREGE